MSAHLKNVAKLYSVTESNEFKGIVAPNSYVDFDLFGAKEIRDILKSRAHCLNAGFPPHHIIITTLNEIRNHYIFKVGLPTYLSQMLGNLGQVPIQYCTLYDQADSPIKLVLKKDNDHQILQRFIAKHFRWDNLPFKVEIRKEPNTDQVETRYL
jgi:hypothetical protein